MKWWQRVWAQISSLFRPAPALLGKVRGVDSVFGQGAADLSDDLQSVLLDLSKKPGVVVDTVKHAIRDYSHLRDVMMGPGASADAVDDVTMIAEAEFVLRAIILRAPDVNMLVAVASDRADDRPGREAAGDAILGLRDRGRALQELASAALQWAASRSEEDSDKLRRCVARVRAQESS